MSGTRHRGGWLEARDQRHRLSSSAGRTLPSPRRGLCGREDGALAAADGGGLCRPCGAGGGAGAGRDGAGGAAAELSHVIPSPLWGGQGRGPSRLCGPKRVFVCEPAARAPTQPSPQGGGLYPLDCRSSDRRYVPRRRAAQVPEFACAFAAEGGGAAQGFAIVARFEVAMTDDLAVFDRIEAIKPVRLIQLEPLPGSLLPDRG